MKIIGGQNIIFLGDGGIGPGFGQIAPQILTFDVFYTQPPIVGFHVVKEPADIEEVCGE